MKTEREQLLESAGSNNALLMKTLIESGIDVNQCSVDGKNALCIAARLGHVEIVKMLLDADCLVDIVDMSDEVWGRQAIHHAASKGHQVCEILNLKSSSTNRKSCGIG